MHISLRPVSNDDDALLFRIYASTRDEELQLVNWSAEQKQAFLEMQFDAQRRSYAAQFPAAQYDVILCDGVAAGRMTVDRVGDQLLVVDIALLPEHRSQGIASALLRGLQGEAAAAGKPLRLHVEFYNRALQLYTRLGFQKVSEVGFHWLMELRQWRRLGGDMNAVAQHTSISDLDPLIITSPVIRSGTTLLQRLLCSSQRALIYGELCAQDLDIYLSLYTLKAQQYNLHRADYAEGLRRVLAGEVNDWILDLMPDLDEYLAAQRQSAFAGIACCRDYARRVGRPTWGFKHPAWQPTTIRMLRTVMPRSRFVFIYRDLVPCLRSAKAGQVIRSLPEATQFCREWKENLTFALDLRDDPAVLLLRYEDLIQQPAAALDRLANFTGVNDLDHTVLNHKVNAYAGEDYLTQAKDGYTKPADLEEAEQQVAEAVCKELKDRIEA